MHYSVCEIKSRKVKGNRKIRGGRRTRGSAASECDMRGDKGGKIRMQGEEGRLDDTVMGEELKRKENNERGLKWSLEDGRNKKSEREREKKTSNMDVERQEDRSGWTAED